MLLLNIIDIPIKANIIKINVLISIFSLSIKNANAEVINGILLTVNKELPIEVIVIE